MVVDTDLTVVGSRRLLAGQNSFPGGSEKVKFLVHALWKTYVAEGVFRERVLVLTESRSFPGIHSWSAKKGILCLVEKAT